MDRFSEETYN